MLYLINASYNMLIDMIIDHIVLYIIYTQN